MLITPFVATRQTSLKRIPVRDSRLLPQNVRAAKDDSENEENFALYYHNGVPIAVRDFVYLQPSDGVDPYVMNITKIWRDKTEYVWMCVCGGGGGGGGIAYTALVGAEKSLLPTVLMVSLPKNRKRTGEGVSSTSKTRKNTRVVTISNRTHTCTRTQTRTHPHTRANPRHTHIHNSNVMRVNGKWYVKPKETFHVPTRTFYQRELIRCSLGDPNGTHTRTITLSLMHVHTHAKTRKTATLCG